MLSRFLFSFLSSCLLLKAAPGDFIRQIQTVNGQTVIYDIPVYNDKGEVLSKPLEAENSIFQLYALESTTDGNKQFIKLDEATVGTYLPKVKLEMLSEDPYPVPRTRADRPYGVRISAAGFAASHASENSNSKKLNIVRSYIIYDGASYLPTDQEGEFQEEYLLEKDGSFVASGIKHKLSDVAEEELDTKKNPDKACGEESFMVCTKESPDSPRSEMAKGTIQIWPVADCEVVNLEANKLYRGIPLNVSVKLRDLYPKSQTKVQVYAGQSAPGTDGIVIDETPDYDTHQPQNTYLSVASDKLAEAVTEDGWYTLEVLTETPFNNGEPELLSSVSFEIKRSIRVNGMMTTAE